MANAPDSSEVLSGCTVEDSSLETEPELESEAWEIASTEALLNFERLLDSRGNKEGNDG